MKRMQGNDFTTQSAVTDDFAIFIENVKRKIANRLAKDMKPVMNIITEESLAPLLRASPMNIIEYPSYLQSISRGAIDNLTTPLQQHYLRTVKTGRKVDNMFFRGVNENIVLEMLDYTKAKQYAEQQANKIVQTLFGGYQENVSRQEINFMKLKQANSFEQMKAMKEYQNLSKANKVRLKKSFEKSINDRISVIENVKTKSTQTKQFDLTRQSIERSAYFESSSVIEEARRDMAETEGAKYKIWVATLDGKTRSTHFQADGERVVINQPFQVRNPKTFATEFMMQPHDFSMGASPENVINCRCTVVYSD